MEAGFVGDWDALELQQNYSIEDIALEALVEDWDRLVHADPTLDGADDEQHDADDGHLDASGDGRHGGVVGGAVDMHLGGADSATDVQHPAACGMQCGALNAQPALGPSQPRDVAGAPRIPPTAPTTCRIRGRSSTQSLPHVAASASTINAAPPPKPIDNQLHTAACTSHLAVPNIYAPSPLGKAFMESLNMQSGLHIAAEATVTAKVG
ncbi:unnamed protein product [Phytophthora fragariaefolia]|uniref:Unnamed protein product n=1 Tax=Phytophthora fragariaefolia TaxID=1490495 RepID=A0A9W7DF22_9STRA|nr:unnamed protein product [Phytophthora fragariaefolia]